jgi:hypothetical protein
MAVLSKCCSKCSEKKPLAEFHVNRRRTDGRQLECRDCVRAGRSRPEVRAREAERKRARRSRPEVRAREAEQQKARRSRPEVREQMAEHRSQPEVRERGAERKRIRRRKAKLLPGPVLTTPPKRSVTPRIKALRSLPEYRAKARCRSVVHDALASRRIVQQPCERCGSVEHIEAHHEDYTKPLEIIWLCRTHHRALHKGAPS